MHSINIDVGITSVGYAVLNLNSNFEPNRIIDMGVRIFDAAENPKDGSPLAEPRRLARGARRRNRRHVHRIDRIKGLLQTNGIISRGELSKVYEQKNLTDIYEIRYEVLDRLVNREEFARLLVHLAQRRGFKSNRKNESKDSEGGKLLSATNDNLRYMEEKGYRTIGEMLFKDEKFAGAKRNKEGDYSNTFLRSQIEEEVKIIFSKQRELGNTDATLELEKTYLDILLSQRSFEEGPASGPYSGNQIEKMVGKCRFESNEVRAVKASYTFEYFNLLQKVNHLTIIFRGEKRFLTSDEKQRIVSLCHKTESVDYKKIRVEMELSDEEYFGALTYGEQDRDKVEGTKFRYLSAYHEMRKSFDKIKKGYINNISTKKRDEIARALTYYKTDEKIIAVLNNLELDKIEIERILEMKSFSEMGHLSIKAMKKIISYLEEGLSYDKACTKAGYDFKGHSKNENKYLPKLDNDCYEVTSNVAKRSINQTIKVINSLIEKYGSPAYINLEMAREMSRSFLDRKEIEKNQKENNEKNERVVEKLKEYGILYPKGQDIIKYRLWEEQQGICLYTNTPLKIEHLFETGYAEIDHIIPYSISFDDGYKNKALVTAEANREKGNKIPMEYVKSKDDFIGLVNALIKNKSKKALLLKTSITDEEQNAMKQRNLQDTQHITSFLLNHIKDNLEFDPICDRKIKVNAINGAVTAYMRKRWRISKIREDGDIHHAIDAVVIGCITPENVQKVTRFSKYNENFYFEEPSKEFSDKNFPLPWAEFEKEVKIRTSNNPKELLYQVLLPNYMDIDIEGIKPIFVSRMVRKKNSGQAHKETIRAIREIDGEEYMVTKTPLQKLKYDTQNDEIIGYYNPSSDRILYELLKERLRITGGDAKKAFPDGKILKPAPKGGKQPEVRKVKIYDTSTLNVKVNGGVAGNGDMVRIDLYKVEGDGYYFVPIYVSDLIKETLPNKACIRGKSYDQWKEMKKDDFLYSIYPNDLIRITAKKELEFKKNLKDAKIPETYKTKEEFVYYKNAGISVSSINVITHDSAYTIQSLGIKTLLSIEKYNVDILGNRHKVVKETRK